MTRILATVAIALVVGIAFIAGRATGFTSLTKVFTVSQEVPAGEPPTVINAECPQARQATGGGYKIGNVPFQIVHDGPNGITSNSGSLVGPAHMWTVTVKNTGTDPFTADVYVVCIRNS